MNPALASPRRRRLPALVWLTLVAVLGAAWAFAPPPLHAALFHERWPFWLGGPAIGLFVLFFLWGDDRQLGVSSGFADACSAAFDPAARRSWRLVFLVGLIGGGVIAAALSGQLAPRLDMGRFDAAVTADPALKALIFAGGGLLIGLGSRLAGGCTSGHGIVGTALLAPASWLATGAFMVAGILTAHLLFA
ncbi:MAG: YeeE/YedE family protein [Deltaproteobacteria bacterium]|nr:YeeE/YedE family protein [Deltaproteobacteria bacterium]MCB9787212.1 YeeE/YedE family protein [Deltaproteobacteria bacterium]